MIGFKSYNTGKRWYANAAQVDLRVKKRSVQTKSGTSPFHYFDGPTMVSYQVPHRAVEAVFCRRQPTPKECRGTYQFDSANPSGPLASLGFGVGDSSDLLRPQSLKKQTFKLNPVVDRHLHQDETSGSITDNYARTERRFARESLSAHNYGKLFEHPKKK